MEERSFERGRRERGFALVLAILSLMLLTFLGLTMAATTSTELQIATNYRWSLQALYNAEAGLEAARIILSNVADPANGWSSRLPAARTGTWLPATPTGSAYTGTGRDYERWECDDRGMGIGYGLVLVGPDSERYEAVSDFVRRPLNGAFTVWVRRGLQVGNDGTYTDVTRNDVLTIVSEGVAPFAFTAGAAPLTGAADNLIRSRQAVRVLETRFALGTATTGDPCGLGRGGGQEGGSPMGENYNPCVNVTAGAGGTLAPVFGGAGAGTLDAFTGVQ